MAYLYVKAFHLIFIVAWMAGMLMYPRLKIYQLKSSVGQPLFEEMKLAAERLRRIILTPSIIAVWVLGLALVAMNPQIAAGGWFALKFLLVLGISGLHGAFVAMGRRIDRGDSAVSERQLRMINEAPFILMIGVVILVIVKPF